MALIALALASPALAQPIRTPANGSAERAAMMNLIRPYVERDFGAPVEFVVRSLNVSGNYALALLDAQRPGGGRIEVERTPLAAERYRSGMVDHIVDCCHAEAILQRVSGPGA
jgi:hypothetical protein